MTPAEDLAKFALRQLRPILDQSGHVLYSSAATLRRGPLYIIGHNPGGLPERRGTDTVRTSLEELPQKTINNYLDEQWITVRGRMRDAGQAALQRHVVWLLEHLGLSPREVPASNLLFNRSRGVASSSYNENVELCWKVHEQILNIVRPHGLIVFGNSGKSPYSFLHSRFGYMPELIHPSGHHTWRCRAFTSPGGLRIIGLPHLSRYDIVDKYDVTKWMGKVLGL